jgi:hypothetical protein
MKERSFTRCTVLVPIPRALAMGKLPLPAAIDSGFVFPRWGRSSGAESFARLYGLCARLARAAPSGGSDSPVGGLDTVPFCLARLGRRRMHHG